MASSGNWRFIDTCDGIKLFTWVCAHAKTYDVTMHRQQMPCFCSTYNEGCHNGNKQDPRQRAVVHPATETSQCKSHRTVEIFIYDKNWSTTQNDTVVHMYNDASLWRARSVSLNSLWRLFCDKSSDYDVAQGRYDGYTCDRQPCIKNLYHKCSSTWCGQIL